MRPKKADNLTKEQQEKNKALAEKIRQAAKEILLENKSGGKNKGGN